MNSKMILLTKVVYPTKITCRSSSSWVSNLFKIFVKAGRNVRQIGDPILRRQAKPVEISTLAMPEFKQLVEDLVATMRRNNAAGIAAPQIGHSLQVIAVEVTGNDMKLAHKRFGSHGISKMQISLFPLKVMVNPKVKIIDPINITFREGCLSVKHFSAMIPRAKEIEVTALTPDGEEIKFRAHGWNARIIQHEMDHLQGNLIIDSMMYKSLINEKWRDYID